MMRFAGTVLAIFVTGLLTVTAALPLSGQRAESSAIEDKAAKEMGAERFIYRQVEGRSLKAFVFFPKEKGSGRAAVLLFHGGAWQLGDASGLFGRAKEFADKGLVAISVDYSLANNGGTPIDSVDDTCAAFVWARQACERVRSGYKTYCRLWMVGGWASGGSCRDTACGSGSEDYAEGATECVDAVLPRSEHGAGPVFHEDHAWKS